MTACAELIDAGRVKLYSVASLNGRILLTGEGGSGRQAWIHHQFFEFLRHEVVPAIRSDCGSDEIEIVAAGPSIGAFNALTCVCWFPDVFKAAVCMSGTYDLRRFFGGPIPDDFALGVGAGASWPSSTVRRSRTSAADSSCWQAARAPTRTSGSRGRSPTPSATKGIPNRVDPWGPQWEHDWPLWRAMLPQYLEELA